MLYFINQIVSALGKAIFVPNLPLLAGRNQSGNEDSLLVKGANGLVGGEANGDQR